MTDASGMPISLRRRRADQQQSLLYWNIQGAQRRVRAGVRRVGLGASKSMGGDAPHQGMPSHQCQLPPRQTNDAAVGGIKALPCSSAAKSGAAASTMDTQQIMTSGMHHQCRTRRVLQNTNQVDKTAKCI
jgi:hypothetical protein